MSVVRIRRSVVEMAARTGMADVPGSGPAGAFVRRGEARWTGTPAPNGGHGSGGEAADVCITSDGVLLQASTAGQALVSAVKVQYVPQDPAVFRVPPDYARGRSGAAR